MRAAWIAIAGAVVLSACAPPAALPSRPPGETFQGIEAPPTGSAAIYIFRPGFSRVSESDSPMLSIDGKEVGRLSVESYTNVILKPGSYSVHLEPNVFESKVWSASWRFVPEAGHIYFLAIWNDIEHFRSFIPAPLPFLFFPTSEVRNRSLHLEAVSEKDALPIITTLTYVPPLEKAFEPRAP